MGKTCNTWIFFCLGMILIVGCGGSPIAGTTAANTTANTANTAAKPGTPAVTWNAPAVIQYGTPLSNTQLDATANVPGSFTYTPVTGTVLHAGTQTLSATFTPADSAAYNSATSSVTITVAKATPIITWGHPAPIPQGTPLSSSQLNATANVAGAMSYSPARGTVLPGGTQQLTATFIPADAADYEPVTAVSTISVTTNAATAPVITWNPPSPVQYGTALSNLQLDAVSSVPGTFSYLPAAGTVPQAGTQKLTAVFTPADGATYTTVTSAVPLAVTQATPVITWGAIAAIKQGTGLGAAQLNATANVPGTFAYSPAPGAVLPAGVQSLTVTFSPANPADYSVVTAVNSVTVTAGSSGQPAPVNGACGPANGAAASVAPTAGLCSAGTASAVTGTGPWTWECAGGNAGTTAMCSAAPAPEATADFVQSIGINTHLGYASSPYYGQSQKVISALQYLGINTIRDVPPGYDQDPVTMAANHAVAAAGVQFDALVVGNGAVNLTSTMADIAAFQQQYPGSIAAIEGPNEINAWSITYDGITDNYPAGVQVTQDLWSAVQSTPSLETVPVYALTLSYGITGVAAAEEQLGNLAPYVTNSNAHIYGGSSNVWTENMPLWLPILEQDAPGRPAVITETGYTTTPAHVDELTAAKYNLNTLFENAQYGIVKTYLYELVDESTSVTDTNVEHNYGQFHRDWTPKTGATAIHNLTTVLNNAGSGSASTQLHYTVSGLPASGHSYLLGSSTAFLLAVWIDATVYDPTNAADIAAPAYPVTVDLGSTYASVTVFDPMTGTTPIATYNNVSTISINVVDHPLVIQINQAGGSL